MSFLFFFASFSVAVSAAAAFVAMCTCSRAAACARTFASTADGSATALSFRTRIIFAIRTCWVVCGSVCKAYSDSAWGGGCNEGHVLWVPVGGEV